MYDLLMCEELCTGHPLTTNISRNPRTLVWGNFSATTVPSYSPGSEVAHVSLVYRITDVEVGQLVPPLHEPCMDSEFERGTYSRFIGMRGNSTKKSESRRVKKPKGNQKRPKKADPKSDHRGAQAFDPSAYGLSHEVDPAIRPQPVGSPNEHHRTDATDIPVVRRDDSRNDPICPADEREVH